MLAANTNLKAFIAATVICSAVPAHAGFMLAFNRDRTPLADFTSLQVTQDDLTIDITRGGKTFTFANMYHNTGAEIFGARSLTVSDSPEEPFVVDFSHPVTNFSVQVAHLGGEDTSAMLEGFSGTNADGSLIASDVSTIPTDAGFSVIELQALAGGIQSVRFGAPAAAATPVYFDNLTVLDIPAPGGDPTAAVPLPPAAYAALATGAVAMIAHRRSRGAKTA